MNNKKRNLLLILPAFIVAYIVFEHLYKYYSLLAPQIDIFAGRNHEYYLLFIINAAVALSAQLVYIVISLFNFQKLERLSIFLALNFVISVISVNLMITSFNILLFTSLAL